MNYTLRFHPAVKKDLRKITPNTRKQITFNILPSLANNPFLGIPLAGPLRGFFKYRVFLYRVWYRIAYTIDHKHKEVVVIAIGPRGGFYDNLRHRIRK